MQYKSKEIAIIGAGGFAKECAAEIRNERSLDDFQIRFYVSDHMMHLYEQSSVQVSPLSSLDAQHESLFVTVAIGNPHIRKKIIESLPKETKFLSFISSQAHIMNALTVKIGRGCFICSGVIITSDVTIGDFCQLNLNTTIGHDCKIGDYFTTAPAVNISGNCTIGNIVYFGTNSATREGVSIPDGTTIGMNAGVVKSIELDNGTWIGCPVKLLATGFE